MHALQLVSFNEEGQAKLHEENLRSVLGHDEVRNRHVVAIAAAGSFRRGKSFFLNYLIHFIKTQGTKSINEDDRLSGFDWKFGLDRVTTGISIWPEVFIINELAVVLIDSQGTFDKETSMKVNTAVVAFSALISSVQIFNYHERFDSQDFANLEFFMKYGELLQRDNFNQDGGKFFQKLLFLIRDWNEGFEYAYGYDGGDGYLKHFLTSNNSKELQSTNEMLGTCFDEVSCFLMPHPGDAVSNSKKFDGYLKDIGGQFLEHIHSLALSLLLPQKLVPKRIVGKLVTCNQLTLHIRAYINLFNSNELPEPKTMYTIMVDEVSGANCKEAREMYCKLMKEAMQNKIFDEEQFNSIHRGNTAAAIQHFKSNQKIGSESQKKKHETVLHELILDDFLRFTEIMRHKREFQQLRKEMKLVSKENKSLQDIVQQLRVDINKKQDQLELQNHAINALQEKMQRSEMIKNVRDQKLASLESQLNQMTEVREEENQRNKMLKTFVADQSEKMRKIEHDLEENMSGGFLSKVGRAVSAPIAAVGKAIHNGISKLFSIFKS